MCPYLYISDKFSKKIETDSIFNSGSFSGAPRKSAAAKKMGPEMIPTPNSYSKVQV